MSLFGRLAPTGSQYCDVTRGVPVESFGSGRVSMEVF